jgi:hypothetical protein
MEPEESFHQDMKRRSQIIAPAHVAEFVEKNGSSCGGERCGMMPSSNKRTGRQIPITPGSIWARTETTWMDASTGTGVAVRSAVRTRYLAVPTQEGWRPFRTARRQKVG